MTYRSAYDIGEDLSRKRLEHFTTEVSGHQVQNYQDAAVYVNRDQLAEAWITLIAEYGLPVRLTAKYRRLGSVTMLQNKQGRNLMVGVVDKSDRDVTVGIKIWQKGVLRSKFTSGATLYPDSPSQNTIISPRGDMVPYKSSKENQSFVMQNGRKALVATRNGTTMTAERVCEEMMVRERDDARRYVGVLQNLSTRLLGACAVETVDPAVSANWEQQCHFLPMVEAFGQND